MDMKKILWWTVWGAVLGAGVILFMIGSVKSRGGHYYNIHLVVIGLAIIAGTITGGFLKVKNGFLLSKKQLGIFGISIGAIAGTLILFVFGYGIYSNWNYSHSEENIQMTISFEEDPIGAKNQAVEIIKLIKEKYPVYNQLEDLVLAHRLEKKFPERFKDFERSIALQVLEFGRSLNPTLYADVPDWKLARGMAKTFPEKYKFLAKFYPKPNSNN